MKPIKKYVTLPLIDVLKKLNLYEGLTKLDLYSIYSLRTSGPLWEYGWFRSCREQASVDTSGNPVPWITYPAYEFLRKRIREDMSVFEYGCGGSTLWWSTRVASVVSVEHDYDWYLKIRKEIPSNVTLHHISLENDRDYARKVAEYTEAFDIIVIDGRDRVNCARSALGALKPDGIIIWDNSDREEYREGYQFLFAHSFRKIEFVGQSPAVNFKNETGIFYRSQNCLGI